MRRARAIPEGWALNTYNAFERFALEAHISKRQLMREVGIPVGGLSQSHLEDPKQQPYLFHLIRDVVEQADLRTLALGLRLNGAGYQALIVLKVALWAIYSGYEICPDHLYAPKQELRDRAMLGVEMRDTGGPWQTALEHLSVGWAGLEPSNDPTDSCIRLRSGAMLASMLVFGPHVEEAVQIVKQLHPMAREPGRDIRHNIARSLFYKSAGVVLQHAGSHPETVLSYLRRAQELCLAHMLDPIYAIAPLRDQAKPYFGLALTEQGIERSTRIESGLHVLDEAEVRSEHNQRSLQDEMSREWLMTLFVRIQCLCIIGRVQEARAVLDRIESTDWAHAACGRQDRSSVGVGWHFANMAIEAVQHHTDQLQKRAQLFIEQYSGSHFEEKRKQASELVIALGRGVSPDWKRILELVTDVPIHRCTSSGCPPA